MNRFAKGGVALIVLLAIVTLNNMAYEDEVMHDEHRAQMEQLYRDSNGEYGWPSNTP